MKNQTRETWDKYEQEVSCTPFTLHRRDTTYILKVVQHISGLGL